MSALRRESLDTSSDEANSKVARIRAFFNNKRVSTPRTTPEFFNRQLRKQAEVERLQRANIREQNNKYRMSLRALTVAVPRRISELESSAKQAATESRMQASRLRLSIGGIMGSRPKHERDGLAKSVRGRFMSRTKTPGLTTENPLFGVKEEEEAHGFEAAADAALDNLSGSFGLKTIESDVQSLAEDNESEYADEEDQNDTASDSDGFGTEADSEDEGELDVAVDSPVVTDAETESQTEFDDDAETGSQTEFDDDAETESQPEFDDDAETESKTEFDDDAETESQTEFDDDAETGSQSELENNLETEAVDLDDDVDSTSSYDSAAESDFDAESTQSSEPEENDRIASLSSSMLVSAMDRLGDMGTSDATLDPDEVNGISDSEVEQDWAQLQQAATTSATSDEHHLMQTLEAQDDFDILPTSEFLQKLGAMKLYNPDNIACKVMSQGMFESYSTKEQIELKKIMASGVEFPDCRIGCYAVNPSDLDVFEDFFDPLIAEYHELDVSQMRAVHDTSASGWDLNGDDLQLPSDVHVEIHASRNVVGHDMCGNMNKVERLAFEDNVLQVLDELAEKYEMFQGQVYSLSPSLSGGRENPNFTSEAEHENLAAQGLMFMDLEDDPFLVEAQFTSDYPYGRGAFISDDKSLLVWYGGEDHLEVVCRKTGTSSTAEMMKTLQESLDALSRDGGMEFVLNDRYGYVTACPSKLGTGLQFTAQLNLPVQTGDGLSKLKEVCEESGLRMVPVDNVSDKLVGRDGLVKVSPVGGLFCAERDQALGLYYGVQELANRENRA